MRIVLLPVMAVICTLVSGASAAAAESQDLPLTLGSAIRRASESRPELTGFQYAFRLQEARKDSAALRPLPQAELLLEDALGTGQRSGTRSAQTSLILSQVVELGGKRAGRVAVVTAENERLKNDQAARQLDVIAEVARRFVSVLEGEQRYELASETVRIAESAQQKVSERVQASRSPPAEAARAGVQLWDAKLLLEDAEHELAIARRFLAATMGEDTVRFGRAIGDLSSLPEVASFESLMARLPQTPDLLRFASEERVRDAELRLAELQRRADPRLTLGARRFEQGNDLALIAGVTVPLFSARNAQPAIDSAGARREQVSSDREALRLKLQAQLFSSFTQLQHEQGLSRTLREELLPRLELALEQATYAYERGRFTYLEWTVAQRELLEGRVRLLESAGRFHVLRIEIERLTGTSLDTVGELE